MRQIALLLSALLLLALVGCAGSKELTCDHCGKTVTVSGDSNMEEDWIIYCAECNEELFAEEPIMTDGTRD